MLIAREAGKGTQGRGRVLREKEHGCGVWPEPLANRANLGRQLAMSVMRTTDHGPATDGASCPAAETREGATMETAVAILDALADRGEDVASAHRGELAVNGAVKWLDLVNGGGLSFRRGIAVYIPGATGWRNCDSPAIRV